MIDVKLSRNQLVFTDQMNESNTHTHIVDLSQLLPTPSCPTSPLMNPFISHYCSCTLSLMIMKLRTTLAAVISLLFDERITTTAAAAAAAAAAPFNACLGTYLPSPEDPNENVLQSPNQMFTLTVKSWIDSSSSYYCMAAD